MKKTGSIILLTGMSILLVGCLVFLYLILRNKVFFSSNAGDNISYVENSTDFQKEDNYSREITGIVAEYVGGKIFAGGRITTEDLVVKAVYTNSTTKEIKDYTCSMLNPEYRLGVGSNTFVINYKNYTTMITLEAVDPETTGIFAPSYILNRGDKSESQTKVDKIEKGELTYSEALSNVAFTGDSQIAALVSYRLVDANSVEALVGASADYLAEKFSTVVTKAYGKDALVVHYGINSLSSSQYEREYRINQYRELLSKLKLELPGTRIIVSGVFPVSNGIVYNKPSFGYINSYDFNLLKMCMDLDIEYYSNNEFMSQHQEYFSADGLHLQPAFYSDYWLKDLILTMGL